MALKTIENLLKVETFVWRTVLDSPSDVHYREIIYKLRSTILFFEKVEIKELFLVVEKFQL
jgi:hypothetical protein